MRWQFGKVFNDVATDWTNNCSSHTCIPNLSKCMSSYNISLLAYYGQFIYIILHYMHIIRMSSWKGVENNRCLASSIVMFGVVNLHISGSPYRWILLFFLLWSTTMRHLWYIELDFNSIYYCWSTWNKLEAYKQIKVLETNETSFISATTNASFLSLSSKGILWSSCL